MNWRISTIPVALGLALAMTACGQETSQSTEIIKSYTFEAIPEANSIQQVQVQDVSDDSEKVSIDAPGYCFVSYTTHSDSDKKVYASPSSAKAAIGVIEAGDDINVIQLSDDNDWYVIKYNGRIAYVKISDSSDSDSSNSYDYNNNYSDDTDQDNYETSAEDSGDKTDDETEDPGDSDSDEQGDSDDSGESGDSGDSGDDSGSEEGGDDSSGEDSGADSGEDSGGGDNSGDEGTVEE